MVLGSTSLQRQRLPAFVVGVLLLACPVLAAEATNIYSGPDLVILYPVEGTAIFVSAVFAASIVEWGIAKLMSIENDYFQLVYRSVAEETIVCSILTMMMIFARSLGTLQPKWVLMLNYAVLSLFFMIVFFIIIISSCVLVLHIQTSRWRRFEGTRIDIDPRLNSRELLFKQCRDRFRESVVGKDLKYVPEMQFSLYMQRMERFTVAQVTDLSWKSWIALAVIVVINGVRSRITTGASDDSERLSNTDRNINVGSYIGFVGYGTLLVFVILHQLLQMRLRHFASSPAVKVDERTGSIELLSSRNLLYFFDFRVTCHMFQCTILIFEWYLAGFVLGMGVEMYNIYGLVSIAVYVAAVLPLLLFIYMLPWTITMVTMLNSLGSDLNVEEANAVIDEAEGDNENGPMAAGGGGDGSPDRGAGGGGAGERDEWNGQSVTLHEESNNKLLDIYEPNLNFRANHPNKPLRKAFEAKPMSSALQGPLAARGAMKRAGASMSMSTSAAAAAAGGGRDGSFFTDGLELPPDSSRDATVRPANTWVDASVTHRTGDSMSPEGLRRGFGTRRAAADRGGRDDPFEL